MRRHPLSWDELTPWPFPFAIQALYTSLEENFQEGLSHIRQAAINPYQRWTAQKALVQWLNKQQSPLPPLYQLAHEPSLNEYLFPPASPQQSRRWPDVRRIIFSELSGQFIAVSSDGGDTSERLAWRLTKRRRNLEPTPLKYLFGLIDIALILSIEDISENDEVKFLYPHIISLISTLPPELNSYPHGVEVVNSFSAIAFCLQNETIDDIAQAKEEINIINEAEQPWLRPPVMETLLALTDISQEVAQFIQATNTGQRSAALNRANGGLKELAEYVQEQVLPPEQVLLQRIILIWQAIIAEEQGKLGNEALRELSPSARRATAVSRQSAIWERPLEPFANPYVVGDPVYPPLLAGRKDIFDAINKVWSEKENPDSIILYGHRRMGKSSILRNLDQVTQNHSLIVYADMDGETSFVESTADFLLSLAERMHTAAKRAYPEDPLPIPDPAHYDTMRNATLQFNRLSETIRDLLEGHAIILALDEFEAIQRAVDEGKIDRNIYRFLRSKTQEPWLTIIFGGLHTLDEMSREYLEPFHGSYNNICVSYLPPEDARKLITNPTPAFNLNYEHAAVDRIVKETGGQPMLVQQVCRDALDNLNHELFDLDQERDIIITLHDVETVLNNDFFQRGSVYFDGVWDQTKNEAQRQLLRTLAQTENPWSLSEILETTPMPESELLPHLQWAERHDILKLAPDETPTWQFHVPLMRRWIKLSTPRKF